MDGYKVVKDNIHGYIRIPKDYFIRFIDTPTFQRLRFIEQTSMRYLYPCARHDRFVHSLGTYHIGKKLMFALRRNLQNKLEIYSILTDEEWDMISRTFEIACLLHDCAHAPFSHILESFMGYHLDERGKAVSGKLDTELSQIDFDEELKPFDDGLFKNIDNIKSTGAAEHEKASALLLWLLYAKDIAQLGGDPLIAMRMIMKYKYTPAITPKLKIFNCIISLLNGAHIDADKLDYIVRDTILSGVDNYSVDLDRIIDSVTIIEQPKSILKIGFNKSSISIIQNIITARNNFYLWIYSHHKTLYYSELLQTCFKKAIGYVYNIKDENRIYTFASKYLSIDSMISPITLSYGKNKEEHLYMVNDNDVQVLLKRAYSLHPEDNDYIELFSRVYKKSLWKSYAEFKSIFNNESEDNITKIIKKLEQDPNAIFSRINQRLREEKKIEEDIMWVGFSASAKLSIILESEIYIDFGLNGIYDYAQIFGRIKAISPFFYLYYSKKGSSLSKDDLNIIHAVLMEFS